MNDRWKIKNWHKINSMGQKCPLPVMRVEKAIEKGHIFIEILADDPVSKIDIPLFAMQNGLHCFFMDNISGNFTFFLAKFSD